MSGLHDLLLTIIHRVVELKHVIRETYRVNPAIFMALYSGSGPLFYYALYRAARAVRRALYGEMNIWLTVVLASTAAPFVYVLAVGRNVPWWAYTAVAVLLLQGVGPMIWKLTRTAPVPAAAAATADIPLFTEQSHIERTDGRLRDRYRSFSRTMARVAHNYHRPRRRRRTHSFARSRAIPFLPRRATNNGYRSLRLVINRSRGRAVARFGYLDDEAARLRAG